MSRVYNFSAGPAVLPEEVLKEAAEEMLDYKGSGMSVMEMSHRSKVYDTIIKEAEQDLRDLMNIPDNYRVLFLQGGASQQFAMIPMNLMKNRKAGYIVTGQWAKRAYQRAKVRPFPISRTARIWISRMIWIMYTSVRITPSTARSIRSFRTRRGIRLLRTFPPASFPSRWM